MLSLPPPQTKVTSPDLLDTKLEELVNRLNMLVGENATEESYKKLTGQDKKQDMHSLKVGDVLERVSIFKSRFAIVFPP